MRFLESKIACSLDSIRNKTLDELKYNREAWDRLVQDENRWTVPVSTEEVNRAREGVVQIVLTPIKIVPQDWYPPLAGAKTLCLAGAGGQQAP